MFFFHFDSILFDFVRFCSIRFNSIRFDSIVLFIVSFEILRCLLCCCRHLLLLLLFCCLIRLFLFRFVCFVEGWWEDCDIHQDLVLWYSYSERCWNQHDHCQHEENGALQDWQWIHRLWHWVGSCSRTCCSVCFRRAWFGGWLPSLRLQHSEWVYNSSNIWFAWWRHLCFVHSFVSFCFCAVLETQLNVINTWIASSSEDPASSCFCFSA